MTGWKTKVGGIGMILTGAGMVASGLVDGDFERIVEGITLAAAGFATLGIGHKIEKASG